MLIWNSETVGSICIIMIHTAVEEFDDTDPKSGQFSSITIKSSVQQEGRREGKEEGRIRGGRKDG